MTYKKQSVARKSVTVHIYADIFMHLANQNNGNISINVMMLDHDYVGIQSSNVAGER